MFFYFMNLSDKYYWQLIIIYGFFLYCVGFRVIDWGFEYYFGMEWIFELLKICDMVDRECFCFLICVFDEIFDIGIIK